MILLKPRFAPLHLSTTLTRFAGKLPSKNYEEGIRGGKKNQAQSDVLAARKINTKAQEAVAEQIKSCSRIVERV